MFIDIYERLLSLAFDGFFVGPFVILITIKCRQVLLKRPSFVPTRKMVVRPIAIGQRKIWRELPFVSFHLSRKKPKLFRAIA